MKRLLAVVVPLVAVGILLSSAGSCLGQCGCASPAVAPAYTTYLPIAPVYTSYYTPAPVYTTYYAAPPVYTTYYAAPPVTAYYTTYSVAPVVYGANYAPATCWVP